MRLVKSEKAATSPVRVYQGGCAWHTTPRAQGRLTSELVAVVEVQPGEVDEAREGRDVACAGFPGWCAGTSPKALGLTGEVEFVVEVELLELREAREGRDVACAGFPG